MNFQNFKTYNSSQAEAFEAMCNHLFENWLKKEYTNNLVYFTTVYGAGGDGGVEAYGILNNSDIIGVQAKWFPTTFEDSQVNQIKKSITAALTIRPNIKKYIVCIPKELTNSKIGKGKKVVTNTEDSKFNKIQTDFKTKYPDLEIVRWDSHRIGELLLLPENEGVQKFWFEKEVFSLSKLKEKFELDREGWLKTRYVPDLHITSSAEDKIAEMLSNSDFRTKWINGFKGILDLIKKANVLIDQFNTETKINPFQTKLSEVQSHFNSYKQSLEKAILELKQGNYEINLPIITELWLFDIIPDLKREFVSNTTKNLQINLSKALEGMHYSGVHEYISAQYQYFFTPHNLIVFGKPSVGKTHALANAVKIRLDDDFPAIIIQAKSVSAQSWSKLLQNALGLNNWTDHEIFTAFQTLAHRADTKRAKDSKTTNSINEPTRVLIAIDGIDEVTSLSELNLWKERINQMPWLNQKYNRLRFVVSVRGGHEMITNQNPFNINTVDYNKKGNRRFDLTSLDISVLKAAPLYFKQYNIDSSNLQNLTDFLLSFQDNLLTLRLFCEINANSTISDNNYPSLHSLINQKIDTMEKEYHERFQPQWLEHEQVIRKALYTITSYLTNSSSLTHHRLCKEITQKAYGVINRNDAAKILTFLCQHGILLDISSFPEDDLLPIDISYQITYQSYLDYFLAARFTKEIITKNIKILPKYVLNYPNRYDVLLFTATTLFQKHGILVGENDYWNKDINENTLLELKYKTIGKSFIQLIHSQLPRLEEDFVKSALHRYLITENIILPNMGNSALKLGINFLHKILSSFSTAFERDIFWSGEAFKDENRKIDISFPILHTKVNFNNGFNSDAKYRFLDNENEYWGLPIYYAWCLASTDNQLRETCRKALSMWGTYKPNDFILLLDTIFFCNDPQIQEDLSRVMIGIVSLIKESKKGLYELSQWILQNIFHEEKITEVLNSVVRYSGRIVVERAFLFGEATKDELLKSRPPYSKSENLLDLDVKNELGERGECYPIVHDLVWYVIDKSYKDFFETISIGEQYKLETQTFLNQYSTKYGKEIHPFSFAMFAAIAYIKKLGFNRTNGNYHTQSTHGGISRQMTLEEKYTWLAVHEIQGYLADRVSYKKDKNRILEDYSEIVEIPNPIDETELTGYSSNEYSDFYIQEEGFTHDKWFIPTDISPIINFSSNPDQEEFKNWITKNDIADFEKWIYSADFFKLGEDIQEAVVLDNYTIIPDPSNTYKTQLEVTCILIKEDMIEEFIRAFKKNTNYLFDSINGLRAYMQATYTSARDITWMYWIEEGNSKIEFEGFELFTTVVNIIENTVTKGETCLSIPSKIIRDLTEIANYEYLKNFNKNQELVSWTFSINRGEYENQQEILFIDKEKFDEVLKKEGLKPIWFVHQFRNRTYEFSQKYSDISSQNFKKYIVWKEAHSFKHYLYHDDRFS